MSAPDDLIEVLSDFARNMLDEFAIQGILDHLVERIVGILPITGAGVTLIGPGRRPRYVAASSDVAMTYEQLQTELREGPCLAAYTLGTAIVAPDLRLEQRFGAFTTRGLELGLQAVFTFPLRHGDVLLGALDLYRDNPGPLSLVELNTAQTLADVASAYLINAQTRADLTHAFADSRAASLHDPLTGLANRILLNERIGQALRRGSRSGRRPALFFIDLDGFKEVNDHHDHKTGDELLVAVARRLTDTLRPGDTCARLGGDEFVILGEDLSGSAQLKALTRRLCEVFERPFKLSHNEFTVAASIGVAVADEGGDTASAMIQAADQAMYREKGHRGVSRNHRHPRGVLPDALPDILQALPGAIARDEMHLEYQPILDTANGQVTSVEALLRWTHPAHGPVPTAAVVPIAEKTGQIIALGQWVLQRACTDQALWRRPSGPPVGVSVNVSPLQIIAPGFARAVADIATNTLADPNLLTLEVTEGVLIDNEHSARAVLQTLNAMGIKLALDDFGTGYSSLSYLSTLPVNIIKIDQRFVTTLTHDSDSQKIITAILALARSLRLTVVAEGVETREQHLELTELRADYCQGFYFAKPMRAHEVAPWINQSLVRLGSSETTRLVGAVEAGHASTPAASEVQRARRGPSCP
jgi:diguanylate cyclase (GGDEF)-like protein